MIICPNCHQQLSDEAKFCGNCATPLELNGKTLCDQPEEDSFVGKCIDNKYYIVRQIARGGMGVIYLAKQKGVGQDVAIKKLYPHNYRDKKIVERFIDEARSYGKITHPNAVKLYEMLNVNGELCLVMEYVHGKTLTKYIESNVVFSIRQIIDISLQLADALATVHQAGIIHRDLKCENVMLLETIPGRFSVKILDFGIAKILHKRETNCTQEGVLVGTPEFMSPEQCYGKPVDHRADIYAFGILMYVLTCGKLPFKADSALAMLQKQVSEAIKPLTRPDYSEVPPELDAIIRKCVEKSADNRYQSFVDVITDLTCMQEGKPLRIAKPKAPENIQSIPLDFAMTEDATISNESAEPEQTVESIFKAEKQAPKKKEDPKSSMIFGDIVDTPNDEIDEIDESDSNDGNFDFSIDDDDDSELSEDRDDDRDPGELRLVEDDGYSLGELDDMDESIKSGDDVVRKGGHGRLIGIIAIFILIAGGVFAFKSGMIDTTPAEKKIDQPILPGSFQSSAEPAEIEDEPQQAAAVPDTPPQEEPIKELEAEPSKIATHEAIQRGIVRSAMLRMKTRINAGELDKATDINTFIAPQLKLMSESDTEQYNAITERQQQFQEIIAKSKTAMNHYNCSEITRMADSIPEEAQGMKAQIAKRAASCERGASAPPTTL